MKDEQVRLTEVINSIGNLSTRPNRLALKTTIENIVNTMSVADKSLLSTSMHIGWKTSTKDLRAYARACALVELTLSPMIFQSGQQLITGYFNTAFTGHNEAAKLVSARNKLNQLLQNLEPPTVAAGHFDYHRPVLAGTSISHSNHQGPGTLGCFVRHRGNNRIMLLSNEHVMQYNNVSARIVIQPARFNGGSPAHAIGLYDAGVLDPRMDAAISYLDNGIAWNNTLPDGTVIAGSNNAVNVGDAVKKYGCMSGMTQGTIAAVNYASTVPHKIGPIAFVAQYNVTSAGAFQIPGDSGSVLLSANNEVIGLLHGGRSDGGAMATPIDVILNHFNVDIA